MALRRPRSRRLLILLALLLVAALVATGVVLATRTDAPVVAEQQERLPVDGVELDTTLFTPAVTPAPAVLLAHGFGGSKASVADQARALAADGFVVLTWSARGFGASGGQIGINDPGAEVADARALVDHLATLPQVQLDGPGDPRVGVAGASYGGALALSLAGTDPRIDADAAAITWNDLGQALLPDQAASTPVAADTPAAGQTGDAGVLKRSWAGIFFAAGASADGVCGKFTAAICQGYLAAAASGEPTASLLTLLRERSPAATNAGVRAPTLLLQGETDTLFGLDQADANAREVAAAGAPVLVSWFSGGHDAGGTNADADAQVADFLAFHLAGRGTDPGTGFRYEVPGPVSTEGTVRTRTITVPTYPGLDGGPTAVTATPTTTLALQGDTQPVLRPPGAAPSSISTVPGLGAALGSLASSVSGLATLDVPGQVARFSTAPLADRLTVTGTPRVSLDVRSLDGAASVLLFAKLYDVAPDGSKTLPGGGVSPFRVPVAPGQATTTVAVTLPGIVRPVEAGHTLQLAVSTTDQAYAVPLTPAVFSVSLAGADLVLPTVGGTAAAASTVPLLPVVLIAVVLALLVALGVVVRLRRRGADDVDAALADTPLVVRGLEKSYADGFRAVDGVDLTVGAGQVLGLLGPNGAGKTTTLRMLMGLITPSAGEILVFGHRVRAGAPVLSRLGSFVEGAGFLPHLSGRVNLELYWSATGRPAQDAHLDEALAIAGLGSAVERKVRGYSQGMRQRLAIAQAMLGLPDLLVLDEPTNGLDPPQIRAMRDVLRDYAATGRTVLVSSHLLAEVEQTCSHVVVMNKGTVVAAGTVAEIVSADGLVVLGVSDPERAVEVLDGVDGVGSVRVLEAGTVQADLARVPAQEAVSALVGAGVGVSRVAPRNRLEDVFLSLVEGNAE